MRHRGEEVAGVYSFPCFTKEFISCFNEETSSSGVKATQGVLDRKKLGSESTKEIASFYASGIPARRPNSMNNYGSFADVKLLKLRFGFLMHTRLPCHE